MNSTLTNSNKSTLDMVLFYIQEGTLMVQFSFGFFLNSYIIFLLLSKGRGVEISFVFILNHSVAEILFSVTIILSVVVNNVDTSVIIILMNVLLWVSMATRLLFLCCVCLERYLAVVRPVMFLKWKALRYRVACSVLVWTCAFTLGSSTFWYTYNFEKIFYKLFICLYTVVLSVEFFCCVSVLQTLKRPGPSEIQREQREMNSIKKKAFHVISICLVTCLVQNIPMVVYFVLKDTYLHYNLSQVSAICTTLNVLAGSIHPVFILHQAGKLCCINCHR